jgi:uncharacterized protein HemX
LTSSPTASVTPTSSPSPVPTATPSPIPPNNTASGFGSLFLGGLTVMVALAVGLMGIGFWKTRQRT